MNIMKPARLLFYAIPGIISLIILFPLITKTEIPFSAVTSYDTIEFELTRFHIDASPFDVINRITIEKTELLKIQNDGSVTYSVVSADLQEEKSIKIDSDRMLFLAGLIKETGFIHIPEDNFNIKEDVEKYVKTTLKVTLNQKDIRISWPDQEATDEFIPPIITMVEAELQGIIDEI